MSGGRPRKYKSSTEMEKKVEAYFKECDKKDIAPTVTGLGLALGMTTQMLREYGGEVPGREKGEAFALIIKRAKKKCAYYLESQALKNKINTTMAIFLLKANHKYRDSDQPQTLVQNIIQERDPEKDKEVAKLLSREGLK